MAITVGYLHPVIGAGAPAAVQVATQVTATVIASVDADANADITHNMNLTAAELAAGFPIVVLEPVTAFAQLSLWYVPTASKTATGVRVTKSVAGGSGNAAIQLIVHILRPHTIGR